jgi:hypothetical protein
VAASGAKFSLQHSHDVYDDYEADLLATKDSGFVLEARITLIEGDPMAYMVMIVGDANESNPTGNDIKLTREQAIELLGDGYEPRVKEENNEQR